MPKIWIRKKLMNTLIMALNFFVILVLKLNCYILWFYILYLACNNFNILAQGWKSWLHLLCELYILIGFVLPGHCIKIHGELDRRRIEERVEDGGEKWHVVWNNQCAEVPRITSPEAGGEDQDARDVQTQDHSQVFTLRSLMWSNCRGCVCLSEI